MIKLHALRTASVGVIICLALAATAAYAGPLLVSEQPVSTNGSVAQPRDAEYSDTYAGMVVYQDENPEPDVFLYNAATGAKPVAIASTDSSELYPRIYGNYVVFARSGNIYLQSLAGGSPRNLTPGVGSSDPYANTYSDIYRNKVVYSRYVSGKGLDVYVYDITSKASTRIVSTASNDVAQAIWGDNVVYTTNKDVFVYNLKTKKSSAGLHGSALSIEVSDARRNRPQVYRNYVTYVAGYAGHDHIFLYDLNTNTERRISEAAATHANPAIHGTRIVYEQGDLASPELVLYDTRAKIVDPGATDHWTLGVTGAMQPSMWGDRISWTDLRNAALEYPGETWSWWKNEDLYTGVLQVPQISIASPSTFPRTVSYSAVTTFLVDVKQPGGPNVADGTRVHFESSTDGYLWSTVTSATTVAEQVTFVTPPQDRRHYYRFWYNGTGGMPATVSAVVLVTPRVSLGTPVAPKTMRLGTYYSVYGSLKPRHTAGSKPVRIYRYRKVSGHWKSYGYVKATASNYSTYSRYKARMRLTTKGSWRLRAYAPADSRHAATWSKYYDYVTVK